MRSPTDGLIRSLFRIQLHVQLEDIVNRTIDLGGGSEEIERSDILNNWGNDTI
jgi:hypothetical protein